MTLEDQAKVILALFTQIGQKKMLIEDACNLVLLERLADGVVIKLSLGKKQSLINQYQILKGELETLISQLP